MDNNATRIAYESVAKHFKRIWQRKFLVGRNETGDKKLWKLKKRMLVERTYYYVWQQHIKKLIKKPISINAIYKTVILLEAQYSADCINLFYRKCTGK